MTLHPTHAWTVVAAACLLSAPATAKSVDEACISVRPTDSFSKLRFDVMLGDFRRGNYEGAAGGAEMLLQRNPPADVRRCALAVQAASSAAKADRERRFAETVSPKPAAAAERQGADRTATDCAFEASNDTATNLTAFGMNDAFKEGKFVDAKAAANKLLVFHRQTATDSQVACAEKIVASVQSQEQREADKPVNQLKAAYLNYIAMQACYESRKEFRPQHQYVTKQELDDARSITKRNEQDLVNKFPMLVGQKESLWEDAKSDYGKSLLGSSLALSGSKHNTFAEQQCKLGAMRFTGDRQNQQQKIKKDF